MILSHQGKSPRIDPTAWIAPTAVVCGDVQIGPEARVLYGAAIVAEGGSVTIGKNCIVLENAVLRSTFRHDLNIGSYCLIGPHAHVVGATIEDEVFIATGVSIFHGANVGRGSEIKVNAVVHVTSRVPAGTIVPISWVAVGDPAELFPPDRDDRIWTAQKPRNFPLQVYGIDRSDANMKEITSRMAAVLLSHRDDKIVT